MKRIVLFVLGLACMVSAYGQQGFIPLHGAGSPLLLPNVPDCGRFMAYVDDLTGTVWTTSSASTTPCTWVQAFSGGSGLTSFTVGNLSPLFTAALGASPTTAPALAFTLSNAAQNSIFAGPASGGAGAPSFQTAPTFSAANLTNFPTFNQNTSGTAAGLSGSQTANYFYASPNGSSGTGSWRALVAADVPTLNQNTSGTAAGLSANIAESQVTSLVSDLAAKQASLSSYSTIVALFGSGSCSGYLNSDGTCSTPGGSMTWPGTAGIAVYAGSSAWGTSLTAPAGTIVGTSDTQTLTNKTVDGVSPTVFGYIDPTSSIQTQLNGKQASGTYVASLSVASANGVSGSSSGGTTPALTIALGAITPTSVSIASDGVHAQQLSLIGQTTNPTIPANSFGWLAPLSASFTAYDFQPPATGPAATDIMEVGAIASGVSNVSYVAAPAGAVVGTTDTQTLTNKSIAGSEINSGTVSSTYLGPPTATVSSGSIAAVTTNNTYIICTTTCNVTPLQAAAGVQLCVRNAPGSATVITLNALGASNYYELTTHAAWGTANHTVVSGGAATDSICLVGYDATHYAVMSYSGTWTD